MKKRHEGQMKSTEFSCCLYLTEHDGNQARKLKSTPVEDYPGQEENNPGYRLRKRINEIELLFIVKVCCQIAAYDSFLPHTVRL
jgi:hypothetical protein